MSDLRAIVDQLRADLEDPLVDAEEKILEEKAMLETVYKGLTGSDSVSARQEELTKEYTLGFLGDFLPGFAQHIEAE